jgi:tight adherence protein B
MPDDPLAQAAAVVGLLRAGLPPAEAFDEAGWGQAGEDGAPLGATPELAVAARLAHATGAPLAPILEACAAAAREEAEAALARDVALAGPRMSARVLAWLPLVGLALAVLIDVGVLRVLASPLGAALVAVAALLTLAGRWWMRRLVSRASCLCWSPSWEASSDVPSRRRVRGHPPVPGMRRAKRHSAAARLSQGKEST